MKRGFHWDKATLVALYHDKNLNLDELAAHFGCCQEAARRALIRFGIPRKPATNRTDRAHPNKARHLSENGFWRGGTTVDRDGYILVKAHGHPAANASGYVRKHRLVMEKKLGRFLTADEVVHHKDGDPRNNRRSNLEVFSTNGAHLAATMKGRCPKWTPAGYQNMLQSAFRKSLKDEATRAALETYARRHNVELFRFLKLLSKDRKRQLRKAVRRGDFEFLPPSWREHVAACQISPSVPA